MSIYVIVSNKRVPSIYFLPKLPLQKGWSGGIKRWDNSDRLTALPCERHAVLIPSFEWYSSSYLPKITDRFRKLNHNHMERFRNPTSFIFGVSEKKCFSVFLNAMYEMPAKWGTVPAKTWLILNGDLRESNFQYQRMKYDYLCLESDAPRFVPHFNTKHCLKD